MVAKLQTNFNDGQSRPLTGKIWTLESIRRPNAVVHGRFIHCRHSNAYINERAGQAYQVNLLLFIKQLMHQYQHV